MNKALQTLGVDAIAGLDIETYYDDDYSLKKMATTEYITDPRFELQLVAVQLDSWTKPKVMERDEFKAWAKTVDWSRTAILGHHVQFDGFALAYHLGIVAAAYLDTLSMARPVMPIQVGGSLKALTEAFGREGKVHGQALVDVKGKHFEDFTRDERKALKVYAGDDISDTWFCFNKLLPHTPEQELRLIDITVRMYAAPSLLLSKHMLTRVLNEERKKKADAIEKADVDPARLTSNRKFAKLLEAEGVKMPTKISKTTEEETLAMAKGDLAFKALLNHPSQRVRDLMEARFAVKSSIAETRAQRFRDRANFGAQPIYLNYWGAKTGRWSGGDSANWQNLGRGSGLRRALLAPKGNKLIIADLGQIEARMLAWMAGQQDILDAFARGEDVYKLAASRIYNKPVDQITNDERFVGKVATLALGYGAGAARFADVLRIGAFGPPMDISDTDAAATVRAWRQANSFITQYWKATQSAATSAFMAHQTLQQGVLTYKGVPDRGFTYFPDGTYMRYDGLQAGHDGMEYVIKYYRRKDGGTTITRQKLYGGLLVQNNTQALARSVIGYHMVALEDAMSYAKIVMSTHDEVVLVVSERHAEAALKHTKNIMTTAPEWAEGLPLAVEAHVSDRYDK